MKLFDYCGKCERSCCKGKDIIPLTLKETEKLRIFQIRTKKEKSCKFLSDTGCTIKEIEPFICRAYPLIFYKDFIGISLCCPIIGEYLYQLTDNQSEAYRHFKKMQREWLFKNNLNKKILLQFSKRYSKTIIKIEVK